MGKDTRVATHTHRQLRRKHNGNEDEQGSRQRFFPCTSIQMRDLPSFLPFLSSPSVHGYSGETEYYNRPNMIFAICRKVFLHKRCLRLWTTSIPNPLSIHQFCLIFALEYF